MNGIFMFYEENNQLKIEYNLSL